MTNKPIIKVSGKVQDLKKVIKNEKPKQTNFLLTIHAEALVILMSDSYFKSLKKITSPATASLMLLTPKIF